MNDNEKIIYCKRRIRETLAKSPNNSLPVFCPSADLMDSFVTASKEMIPELIARQIIPIIVANENYLADSARGVAHMFCTLTLLAETLSKISRKEPQKIIEQFASSAREMLLSMSQQEVIEYCRKYGLPLSQD